ncbi:ABC transporter ATP-binding protein [Maritalea sp.]|uniref:ABC transporter ATP-binding protein n=1 Tax=Maritalea sp. TaxID=2003361 RepID=UPI003EF11E73
MISLENVRICYGEVEVIPELSVEIESGEFFTLLGPSGCGKTTVLRAIAGFVPAVSGRIIINGEDVTHIPAERRDVGIVFQNYALFPHMTVRENVAFGLKVARKKNSEIKSAVDRILDVTGIGEHSEKKPEALSGGQQQRVAIARSLVMGTKVLLFDEPLSNLDTKVRDVMRKEIKRLQKELGFTAVFVTHDQEEALSMSDRLLVFNNGRADQIGTAREIYNSPATPFVCDFVGGANELSNAVANAFGLKAASRHFVRPEDIKFFDAGENNQVVGKVRNIDFLGATTFVDIELLDHQVSVSLAQDNLPSDLKVGLDIAVQIDPSKVHSFGGA